MWPRIPFVKPIVASDTNPEWMYFFSAGQRFDMVQSTVIGWEIGALLLRLSEFADADPCPPYFAEDARMFLRLGVQESNVPTVALCIRAIIVFDLLLSRWGTKATAFHFGQGFDLRISQGTFEIGFRRPRGTL